MLLPKKVKFRKWQTARKNAKRSLAWTETRGTTLAFGSYGLKTLQTGRIRSNQIEAARKVISRFAGKNGRVWIRSFPDRPFTAKAAEVGMGVGKGDPQGYCVEIKPGRIIFEIDGLDAVSAKEALRKGGTKLPVKTKILGREIE